MSTDNTLYWLALARVEGLGVRGAHKLVEHFGSPQAAFAAPASELERQGVASRVAQNLSNHSAFEAAERECEAAVKVGCTLVTHSDDDYPRLLRQTPDPPLALYVLGDRRLLAQHAVAIVGTRRPTAYGSSVAHRLGADLAQRQLVIVSGLARGIDSAAHRGALEAKGRTMAVLGSGADVIYPRENKSLAERICKSGAVISEFPLGTAPQPENFPIRNRVISGLALGTVIVEAAEYSGSLITARLAAEQNREVYAVPGNITSPQSFGTNLLIKQGAKLVDNWMDVVEEFPATIRSELLPRATAAESQADASKTQESTPLFQPALTPDQRAVYEALRVDQALFIDAVCGSVPLAQPRILTALLELEMSGLVRQLPGKNFIRKL